MLAAVPHLAASRTFRERPKRRAAGVFGRPRSVLRKSALAGSALLRVAFVALWIRGGSVADTLGWSRDNGFNSFYVMTLPGGFRILRVPPQAPEGRERGPWVFRYERGEPDVRFAVGFPSGACALQNEDATFRLCLPGFTWEDTKVLPDREIGSVRLLPGPEAKVFGTPAVFQVVRRDLGPAAVLAERAVVVGGWPPVALRAAAPVVASTRVRRRRRRRARGRCASCGYDLRGHAGRAAACPECGRAA
jgi:hypothetical protein